MTDIGVQFRPGAKVEIPFEVALDAEDLAKVWPAGTRLSETEIFLNP